MRAKKILVTAVALLVGAALLASAGAALLATTAAASPPNATANATANATVKATDYSQRAHWLPLPTNAPKRVAVFYLYPTEYVAQAGDPIIGPVNDPTMMAGAQVAFQRQAWVFRTFANIYAPYFRQADSAMRAAMPQKEQDKVVGGAPGIDGVAAFKYFIKHYDRGRPFILAGHSQGSAVLKYLLSDYMKAHPAVCKRMTAAYVVGQSITPAYLAQNPILKFAKGANDTGVIVSWNTEAATVDGTNPVILPHGIAINPITWTRGQTVASAAQNLGSIELNPATGGTPVLNANGTIERVMNLADACVNKTKGVVICSTIDPAQPPYFRPGGFPQGVLHTFDYPLYFFDVRANAANRARHFFASHKGFR
jgi:hypothetical protein